MLLSPLLCRVSTPTSHHPHHHHTTPHSLTKQFFSLQSIKSSCRLLPKRPLSWFQRWQSDLNQLPLTNLWTEFECPTYPHINDAQAESLSTSTPTSTKTVNYIWHICASSFYLFPVCVSRCYVVPRQGLTGCPVPPPSFPTPQNTRRWRRWGWFCARWPLGTLAWDHHFVKLGSTI